MEYIGLVILGFYFISVAYVLIHSPKEKEAFFLKETCPHSTKSKVAYYGGICGGSTDYKCDSCGKLFSENWSVLD